MIIMVRISCSRLEDKPISDKSDSKGNLSMIIVVRLSFDKSCLKESRADSYLIWSSKVLAVRWICLSLCMFKISVTKCFILASSIYASMHNLLNYSLFLSSKYAAYLNGSFVCEDFSIIDST